MENKDNEAFVEEIANEALLEEVSEKPRKGNGRIIYFCSCFCIILLCIQGMYFMEETKRLNSEITRLLLEKKALEEKLGKIVGDYNDELNKQLQSFYKTKYANQTIYYWDGSFKETDWYYIDKGKVLEIYTQKDGYGLTDDGWVPMDRLEKRFQE